MIKDVCGLKTQGKNAKIYDLSSAHKSLGYYAEE